MGRMARGTEQPQPTPRVSAQGTKPGWEPCISPIPRAAGDVDLHTEAVPPGPASLCSTPRSGERPCWGRKGRRAMAAPGPIVICRAEPPSGPPSPTQSCSGSRRALTPHSAFKPLCDRGTIRLLNALIDLYGICTSTLDIKLPQEDLNGGFAWLYLPSPPCIYSPLLKCYREINARPELVCRKGPFHRAQRQLPSKALLLLQFLP